MPTFNLLERGWIPCLRNNSGPPEYLSIRQVFQQANAIRRIADPAPTVTAMLHRLLLAILHRSLNGPQSTEQWGAIWRARTWDFERLDEYLYSVHEHFDLFDATHPFYQTTGLTNLQESNLLAHDWASIRNRSLLFDHSLPGRGMAPDAAARYLIAQQGFSVGGMFNTNPGEGTAAKFAVGSPLLKSAVCLVNGETLFETLMLNWHQYNRDADQPFEFRGDDKPAWERDEPVTYIERRPDGWVDLLTFQCRRILLQPTTLPDGRIIVTHAALMQGYRLPESFDQRQAETMVAYTVLNNPPRGGGTPWIPVSLILDKAIWRDSHALFQTFDADHRRPRILDWLHQLIGDGELQLPHTSKVIPLSIYGIIPNQATIDDWRSETITMPQLCLGDETTARFVADIVRQELEFAENIARLLEPYSVNLPPQGRRKSSKEQSPVRVLAGELLRPNYESDSANNNTADPKAAAEFARHLSPAEDYWAALDSPFRTFLDTLATEDIRGDYRGIAARAWASQINRIARQCFDEMANGLANSGREMRAEVKARQTFNSQLARLNTAHEALLPR